MCRAHVQACPSGQLQLLASCHCQVQLSCQVVQDRQDVTGDLLVGESLEMMLFLFGAEMAGSELPAYALMNGNCKPPNACLYINTCGDTQHGAA